MNSDRGVEALKHVAHGKTIDEVAHAMSLSRSSVEKYLSKARKALDARTIAHAIHLATRKGLLCLLVTVTVFNDVDVIRRATQTVRVTRRETISIVST